MTENILYDDLKPDEFRGTTLVGSIEHWNLFSPGLTSDLTKPFEIFLSDVGLEHEKTSDALLPLKKKNILESIRKIYDEKTFKKEYVEITDIFKSRKNQLEKESVFSLLSSETNNWLNADDWAGIIIPQEGFTRTEFKKNPITETILKLNKRFAMSDIDTIGDFLVDLKQTNPLILAESEIVVNEIHGFFEQQDLEYSGFIETEYDFEDEARKNLRFIIQVENQDVKACLELSKNLITKIAVKNKTFLRNINIKIISK